MSHQLIDRMQQLAKRVPAIADLHTTPSYDFEAGKQAIQNAISSERPVQHLINNYMNELSHRICGSYEPNEIFPLTMIWDQHQANLLEYAKFASTVSRDDVMKQYQMYLAGIQLWRVHHKITEAVDMLLFDANVPSFHRIAKCHAYLIKAEFHAEVGDYGLAIGFIRKAEFHGYHFDTHEKLLGECFKANGLSCFLQNVPGVSDRLLKLRRMFTEQ